MRAFLDLSVNIHVHTREAHVRGCCWHTGCMCSASADAAQRFSRMVSHGPSHQLCENSLFLIFATLGVFCLFQFNHSGGCVEEPCVFPV